MKEFLFKLSIIFIPIVGASFFIDRYISENLSQSNHYAKKEYPTWNAIFNGQINSKVLIYGSSRAWVHFDPKILEDSLKVPFFNLGINGHHFDLQYLRHLLLLKYNLKPDLIIHSIDIGTLQIRKDLYNEEQFLPYMLWNDEIMDFTSKYEGYKFVDYKIPLVRYYGKYDAIKEAIKMRVTPHNNPAERIRGYQGQVRPWNEDLEIARKKMKAYQVQIDSASFHLFEKYLKDCKNNNIKLVFVYAPEFIDGQLFVHNRAEVVEMYKLLSKKYGILFMDFSNDEICYQKKYFYNAMHMNKAGAELFTQKLAKLLKEEKQFMDIWRK